MKKHIMVVDDSRFNLAVAKDALEGQYTVTCVSSGIEALKSLEENTPDLILLDIIMPGMDGIETMKRIQKRVWGADIPIIFLTGETDNEVEAECLALGAQDFIAKPFFKPTMLHRIARILELEDFKRAAKMDALTGTWNRKYFEDHVQSYLNNAGEVGAFFMLDIDNFKRINDTYGHLTGDELLVRFSKVLSSVSRQDDLVGRLGGDEFAIFSRKVASIETAKKRSSEIVAEVAGQLGSFADGRVSTSVGITIIDEAGLPYKVLYERADKALYSAKNNGKNTYCIDGVLF